MQTPRGDTVLSAPGSASFVELCRSRYPPTSCIPNWSALCAGSPLDLIANEVLRTKMQEPLNLLGKQRFANIDIRVRAKGGGHVSQAYGVQQWTNCAGCSQDETWPTMTVMRQPQLLPYRVVAHTAKCLPRTAFLSAKKCLRNASICC